MAEPRPAFAITAHEAIPREDALVVDEGLGEYNDGAAPLHEVRPLACFARQGDGPVVGGAIGRTWGRHAELQQLWVDPARRHRGIATSLLERFHAEGAARGCDTFYLETWTFQAVGFYRRLGYETAYVLEDVGPGHDKHLMIRHAKGA